MGDIGSRDELAAMIEGKSDDEINAGVAERGTEKVLGQILAYMATRFVPERAGGQSAVIGWDVTSPEGTHQYQLKVADGTCTAVSGSAEPARVTLGMALPDFLRFLTGKIDGMQAFMTGKLKLSGDMMFAQSMQAWFSQ
ncbi:MAG TPA: SCP2 sterol-binding domain-containing protein [Acidimicrobiia bacterium]|nr:SCP2 sterol-binding domain-containing protein [Acidimicrobiia bacterium]HMC79693.1 SCP2 sterol-binding domain-containing protein [Acidimicrobiia bacterium]